jgi:hypothetical protein
MVYFLPITETLLVKTVRGKLLLSQGIPALGGNWSKHFSSCKNKVRAFCIIRHVSDNGYVFYLFNLVVVFNLNNSMHLSPYSRIGRKSFSSNDLIIPLNK